MAPTLPPEATPRFHRPTSGRWRTWENAGMNAFNPEHMQALGLQAKAASA